MRTFAYQSSTETINTLIDSFVTLSEMAINKEKNSQEYKEMNTLFNAELMKYCAGDDEMFAEYGMESLKNPMGPQSRESFVHKFTMILAQAIIPAVPTIISNNYAQLFDVTQVGYGVTPRFTVESNEMFEVYDMAQGILNGTQQTLYNTEYSIPVVKKNISVQVSWYQVACNVMDWGSFGAKVALSFQAYVYAAAIKAMGNIATDAAELGVAGFQFAGFSDDNWVKAAQTVQLANGNADVYALGTRLALSKVMPESATFRHGPTDDITTVGYLPAYKDVPMVLLDQALIPNTVNTSEVKTMVPDDYIYFMPVGGYKPVHVVFEGSNAEVQKDPLTSKDLTFGMTISMLMGVGTIVGSKFAILDM